MKKFVLCIAITILILSIFCTPALAETTCEVKDCKITITIKIAFAGATDQQIADWTKDIKDTWNGPNGFQTTGDCKCPVTFKVETMKITNASQANCKPPPAGYHCVMVTPWKGTDASLPFFYNSSGQTVYVVGYMGYSTQSPTNGPSIDGWWSDQMNRPAPDGGIYHDAAHEAGHMMGLADKDGNGLMSNTSGANAKPTQANIDTAVQNVCGADACPARCCCGNGVIDNNKGEGCDPNANPQGCTLGQMCCSICCQCHATEDVFNFNLESVPLNVFSNERINVHIDGSDTFLVTQKNKIISAGEKNLSNPTLNVYIGKETAAQIHDGNLSMIDAIDQKKVTYEGVGFFKMIKFTVIGFLFGIFY